MDAEIVQIITTALAVLGAVLGLYNAWRNWVQDRVRLVVEVSAARDVYDVPHLLVDIRNLSTFPVTVTHLGFDYLGRSGLHAQIAAPSFVGSEKLPVRLAPRTSATAFVALAAMENEKWAAVRHAYIKTACGLKRVGGRRTFNDLRLSIAPEQRPGTGKSIE